AGEIESFRIDKRYLRPDGRAVWVRAAVALTQPGEMVQNQFVAVVVDIDAEREAEQRLRRQAALLDATRDAITVTGLDQRISFWNRGAERLFGWSADETLGRSARELLALNPLAAEEAQAQLLAHGDWAGPLHLVRKDGRFLVTDTRWTLLRNAEGQPEAILTTQTDATQRLELEAQLRQAQRLEAVGQLTGGVAHDFNNLLTVILGNADLLAEMLADNPSLLPLAQMTRTAAERGAELTQRLLAFARKQALQPQAVDTHQLLASMDALLRRTLPAHIDLELVRAAGQWPALVDPAQLESAVLNLVLNARDAMPAGGKITLETANAWIDQDYAERHADVLPGQYVLLTVSDTGAGMAPGQLARAFEPFFTTKGPGQGSGLGLSMVYGFIKQSRGHVKLYSELGQGTTVRLYLPRADSAPSVLTPAAVRGVQELHGSARVLVVEDDALVRRHATDALTGLGYAVLAAEHGDAALAILRQRADIDLLFTDIVMPGSLNGRQLAEAALVLHPRLKVLYTSGYTENAIVHHGRLDRGVHLLPKPYRSLDLARKVHAVLRGT
ncbi:MAG: PAS domain S-box protein, partial [Chitinophagaceae bacterium]|nr:PAS domain S-box protein [Rubrivivax sp.]